MVNDPGARAVQVGTGKKSDLDGNGKPFDISFPTVPVLGFYSHRLPSHRRVSRSHPERVYHPTACSVPGFTGQLFPLSHPNVRTQFLPTLIAGGAFPVHTQDPRFPVI